MKLVAFQDFELTDEHRIVVPLPEGASGVRSGSPSSAVQYGSLMDESRLKDNRDGYRR